MYLSTPCFVVFFFKKIERKIHKLFGEKSIFKNTFNQTDRFFTPTIFALHANNTARGKPIIKGSNLPKQTSCEMVNQPECDTARVDTSSTTSSRAKAESCLSALSYSYCRGENQHNADSKIWYSYFHFDFMNTQ